MEKGIWLSYDFGVISDYEGFYTWLDSKNAIECGGNTAFFKIPFSDDFIDNLKKEIEENVQVDKKTRIYVTYQIEDAMKGEFIFGRRRPSSWTGYANFQENEEEEDG